MFVANFKIMKQTIELTFDEISLLTLGLSEILSNANLQLEHAKEPEKIKYWSNLIVEINKLQNRLDEPPEDI